MKELRLATRFKRDRKRIKKRGWDLERLERVADLLCEGAPLPEPYRDHQLQGVWADFRECHIGPDWLLIYQADDDEVLLARTGTHADLFE